MTYAKWSKQVVKNLQILCGDSPQKDGRRTDTSWMKRWHQAGVTPLLAAHNCCALTCGWEPKNPQETPFDGLSIAFG